METEIEVKFLNVEFNVIRQKLNKLGAKLEQPMRTMRRVVLDYPDRRMQTSGNAWVRVRDEGDKVTLTYKTSIENEFGGAQEIETTVGSYEKTIEIFKSLGFVVHADQETRREFECKVCSNGGLVSKWNHSFRCTCLNGEKYSKNFPLVPPTKEEKKSWYGKLNKEWNELYGKDLVEGKKYKGDPDHEIVAKMKQTFGVM